MILAAEVFTKKNINIRQNSRNNIQNVQHETGSDDKYVCDETTHGARWLWNMRREDLQSEEAYVSAFNSLG